MKKIIFNFTIAITLLTGMSAFGQNRIEFDLTDNRAEFSKKIAGGLILKVTKDRSTKTDDFGWIIGVFKKKDKMFRNNLIYTNLTGNTADNSQVYAWHVGNSQFPLKREISIKKTSKKLKIRVIDPVVEGVGPDAAFISGKLEISW